MPDAWPDAPEEALHYFLTAGLDRYAQEAADDAVKAEFEKTQNTEGLPAIGKTAYDAAHAYGKGLIDGLFARLLSAVMSDSPDTGHKPRPENGTTRPTMLYDNPSTPAPGQWRESRGDWHLELLCRNGETVTAAVTPARDSFDWNWIVTAGQDQNQTGQGQADRLGFARTRARQEVNRLADHYGGPA